MILTLSCLCQKENYVILLLVLRQPSVIKNVPKQKVILNKDRQKVVSPRPAWLHSVGKELQIPVQAVKMIL